MSNPLQNLKIDYWYKAILVIATATLLLALTVELKSVENSVVQLFSIAAILIGCGEWVNHPLKTVIYPPSAQFPAGLQGEGYVRSNSFIGVVLVILGIGLAGYQIWQLFP